MLKQNKFSMKRCCSLALLLGVFALSRTALAQDSAPSSHLVFDDNFDGDIIINEVRVPKSGEAMYTYYEALGWRGTGAGYAGIQAHPRAHNFIFSIWDHKAHKAPILAVHRGPGTETERFGGEGTGLKSWNFDLGWKTGVWYTLVARAWPQGENTNFGFWSRAGDTQQWTHLVTMTVAAPDAKFEGPTDAFIEDWLNTGESPRTTHLRGGWKRAVDGRWHPFRGGRYSVNAWDLERGKRSYNYRTNWDGGVARDDTGQFFYMTAGGKTTKPTTSNPSQHAIARKETEPSFPAIRIADLEAELNGGKIRVRWRNDPTTAPQFAYELAVFDNREGNGKPIVNFGRNLAHQREDTIDATALDLRNKCYYVRFRCRDIFDRMSEWKVAATNCADNRSD